jgi:hypothetical protein
MSSLGKIRKNAQKFNINQMYSNMTPEDYQNGIKMAIHQTAEELNTKYRESINAIKTQYEEDLKQSVVYSIETLSVELLYELAKELGCFDKEPEYLEDKIDRVQEIYENTMNAIKKYTKYKTDNQARREFEKKKNKVEKMFDIKF